MIEPPSTPQVVQVLEEQRAVAALIGRRLGDKDLAGTPVNRAGQVALAVGPWRLDRRLLALEHPHPDDLGIGTDLDLVLPDDCLILGQIAEQSPQFGQPGPSLLVVGGRDRSRPSVHEVSLVQHPPDRLATGLHALAFGEQQRQHGTGPPTAEEAEILRGLGGDPGHQEGDPSEAQPKGASAFPPGQSRDALVLEPLEPAVDGSAAAKEDGLDVGPGPSLVEPGDSVGSEPEFGVRILAVDRQQFVALGVREREYLRVSFVRGE